jgi:hypothetical protein
MLISAMPNAFLIVKFTEFKHSHGSKSIFSMARKKGNGCREHKEDVSSALSFDGDLPLAMDVIQ